MGKMGPPLYMTIPSYDGDVKQPHPFAAELQRPNPIPDFACSREFFEGARPHQLSPMGDAQATRYTESVMKWDARDITEQTIFELARVFCPVGCHGVLLSIETHLLGTVGPPPGVPKNYNTTGDPFAWETDHPGFAPRYFLQAERPKAFIEPLVATHIGETIMSLPGVPFSELAVWTDSRFAWAQTGVTYPLRLQIPEKTWIRLYQAIPRGSSRDHMPTQIAGRLRAVVQHYRDNEAAIRTSRLGW